MPDTTTDTITITITNNVPAPAARERVIRTQYPFHTMEVGDLFTIAADHEGCKVNGTGSCRSPKVALAMYYHARKYGKTFVYRTNADKSITVWRTE